MTAELVRFVPPPQVSRPLAWRRAMAAIPHRLGGFDKLRTCMGSRRASSYYPSGPWQAQSAAESLVFGRIDPSETYSAGAIRP
jgi:hypothetical protein